MGRALKHGLADLPERFFASPALQTTFRRPHPVIPRQVAPEQSLLLFHWTNVRVYTGGSLPEPAKHFVEVLHETER